MARLLREKRAVMGCSFTATIDMKLEGRMVFIMHVTQEQDRTLPRMSSKVLSVFLVTNTLLHCSTIMVVCIELRLVMSMCEK
jgi:hypothetical protein